MSVRSSTSLDSFGRPTLYRSSVDAGLTYTVTTKSLQFGSGKYVNCGTSFKPERTDSFSICLWHKGASAVLHQEMCNNYGAGGAYTGFSFQISPANKLGIWLCSNYGTGNNLRVYGSTSIADSTWRFLTVTYNGSSLASGCILYVNATPETPSVLVDSLSGSMVSGSGDLAIGKNTIIDQYTNGKLCECSIYNRVLTPSEITEIYNSSKPTNLSVTTTYSVCSYWWRCGTDDTYPTIIDQKAVQNGTMTGMSSGDIVTDAP